MAGIGCGTFAGFSEGVVAMVSLGDRVEPNSTRAKEYEAGYHRYQDLWPLLKDYVRRA
jgi:sugar (pentulose or hexulose) kinase